MPILELILGDGFRLDHFYGIQMRAGAGGLRLHGGNSPYDPPEFCHFRDGRPFSGLVVVAWNLVDSGPGRGGFVCIPGSHKANYPVPDEVMQAHEKADCLGMPEATAGSIVIFTEALTHGTAPWLVDNNRRALLFKYSPAQQSWGSQYAWPPRDVELSTRQQLLFERPYFSGRRSLFHDGTVPSY